MAAINPLCYRGYYYDEEIGLYYLQSRYYDPQIGRFINADSYSSTGQGIIGHNMYAYCGNNPVSRADDGGKFWNIVIGAAVGAVVSGVVSFVSQAVDNGIENVDWARVGVSVAAGAVSGGLAATGILVGGQVIANGIIGAVSSGIDTYLASDGKASLKEYTANVAIGAGLGMLGGLIGGNGTGTKHLTKNAGQALKRAGNAIANVEKAGVGNVAKEVWKAGKYYYSQVATLAIRAGKQAISPIVASNIPSAIYNIVEAFA